jgi:GntR family transcriptional regulator, transcriptional repressor for pyruvate dehydrogenase complex
MSEADLQRLEVETDNMERHWETGDLLANVEADLKSHLLIASACPNRMLVDLYHSVRDRLTATQVQPIPIPEPARMRDSIEEHRNIVATLRRREAESAVRAMESHIRNTARCVGVELP